MLAPSSNPAESPCSVHFDVHETESDLAFLRTIKWAIFAVNIATTLGTIVYLVWYAKNRNALQRKDVNKVGLGCVIDRRGCFHSCCLPDRTSASIWEFVSLHQVLRSGFRAYLYATRTGCYRELFVLVDPDEITPPIHTTAVMCACVCTRSRGCKCRFRA